MAQRILIVDGDPATIQWLTAKFEHAGFATESANHGDLAWQRIQAAPPDLVVLDLTLPDQNGLDLIRLIRQSPLYRHIGIIVLSQRVEQADVSTSLQAGADHYIVKRAGADIELIAKVRAQLEQPRKSAPTPSHGRIFSFCSAKGGSGTTSVCVNTAFALAKAASPSTEILVLDMVLPMGTVAQSLGFETHKTIAQLTQEVHGGIDITLLPWQIEIRARQSTEEKAWHLLPPLKSLESQRRSTIPLNLSTNASRRQQQKRQKPVSTFASRSAFYF